MIASTIPTGGMGGTSTRLIRLDQASDLCSAQLLFFVFLVSVYIFPVYTCTHIVLWLQVTVTSYSPPPFVSLRGLLIHTTFSLSLDGQFLLCLRTCVLPQENRKYPCFFSGLHRALFTPSVPLFLLLSAFPSQLGALEHCCLFPLGLNVEQEWFTPTRCPALGVTWYSCRPGPTRSLLSIWTIERDRAQGGA